MYQTQYPSDDTLDTVYDLLRNSRRRFVIDYVAEHDAATIGDLAELLAAHELDIARQMVSSDDRKRVYTSLYQSHLPKLSEADALIWDKQSGRVTTGARMDVYVTALRQSTAGRSWFARVRQRIPI